MDREQGQGRSMSKRSVNNDPYAGQKGPYKGPQLIIEPYIWHGRGSLYGAQCECCPLSFDTILPLEVYFVTVWEM